jgi:hypothetical protein
MRLNLCLPSLAAPCPGLHTTHQDTAWLLLLHIHVVVRLRPCTQSRYILPRLPMAPPHCTHTIPTILTSILVSCTHSLRITPRHMSSTARRHLSDILTLPRAPIPCLCSTLPTLMPLTQPSSTWQRLHCALHLWLNTLNASSIFSSVHLNLLQRLQLPFLSKARNCQLSTVQSPQQPQTGRQPLKPQTSQSLAHQNLAALLLQHQHHQSQDRCQRLIHCSTATIRTRKTKAIAVLAAAAPTLHPGFLVTWHQKDWPRTARLLIAAH